MSGKQQARTGHTTQNTHLTPEDIMLYVMLAAQGEEGAREAARRYSHLHSDPACTACSAEIEALLQMERLAYGDSVPRTYAIPDIRLPRLDAHAAPHPSDSLLRWVEERGEWLLRLSRALLDSLKPAQLSGALRGKTLYSGTVESESGASARLDIRAEASGTTESSPHNTRRNVEKGGTVSVTVQIEDPDRNEFEQGGMFISLRGERVNLEVTTDDAGEALFAGVPVDALPTLTITIVPPQDAHPKP